MTLYERVRLYWLNHVSPDAASAEFRAIGSLRLVEKPAKYGRQFSDAEVAAIASRLFGTAAEAWPRGKQVAMLEKVDAQAKQRGGQHAL